MNCLYTVRALIVVNDNYEWYIDSYPNYERAKKKFQYLKEHGAEFIELCVRFERTQHVSVIAHYSALEERS